MGEHVGILSESNLWGLDILILVTLGTNDKSFERLLAEVERLIDLGLIQEEVVVQAGKTIYHSEKMKIWDLLPMSEMEQLTKQCSLLITHGGVGSIISALKYGKRVIAVPRLEKYKEHVNDHQLQIIRNFGSSGCIIGTEGVEELENALEKAKTFVPQPYQSNTENMVDLIRRHING